MTARMLVLFVAVVGLPTLVYGQAEDRWMPAYKTTTAPTIDGSIDAGEWDAAGPPIVVNQDSPNRGLGTGGIAEDVYGGDEDLSFSFRAMWAEAVPNPPRIVAPLVQYSKPIIAALAAELGLKNGDTWSCYAPEEKNGVTQPCGHCDACLLHHHAWRESRMAPVGNLEI